MFHPTLRYFWEHREKLPMSLNMLYKGVGISRQGFHQYLDRQMKVTSIELQLLFLVNQIRSDHPTMGLRDMYYKLQPEGMGRDAFERFCREEGLGSSRKRNPRRTTDSSGVVRFKNLLEGLSMVHPDQAWQSDITYYEVSGRFCYITFIMDAFTRRILGYQVSERLYTEHTTLPALRMAIRTRGKNSLPGLIFHSDGGGQYYDKEFLALTQRYHIQNSMGEYAWENGKAERLNGIIKNNYLVHRSISSFRHLQREVDRSVLLYNTGKPHIKLQRKTPVQFENDYFCKDRQVLTPQSTILALKSTNT